MLQNDSIAYYKIRNYLENNGFLHRQGSGYISKKGISDLDVIYIVEKMMKTDPALKKCFKRLDLTKIGITHDLLSNQELE